MLNGIGRSGSIVSGVGAGGKGIRAIRGLRPGDVGSKGAGLTHVYFAIVASAEYLNTLFVGKELVEHELLKGGGVSAIRVSVVLERFSPRPEDGKSVLSIVLLERPGDDVVITKYLRCGGLGGQPVMVDEVKQINIGIPAPSRLKNRQISFLKIGSLRFYLKMGPRTLS